MSMLRDAELIISLVVFMLVAGDGFVGRPLP
jgi:hypothetical protein